LSADERERKTMEYLIGVDIGGTFTDAAVVDEHGAITVGKAPTTPADPSGGFFAALEVAAGQLGLTLEELLARTARLAHGTTVGTNAVVTRRGARVGLLATMGHGDTLKIMDNVGRATGVDILTRMHYPSSDLPEPFVAPGDVREIVERVDARGRVVVALDQAGLIAAVDELVADGAEAIAVCFLWSFMNDAHELRAAQIIAERHPGMPVALSHQVAPKVGEYPRMATTALNAYLQPLMESYTRRIEERARSAGYEHGVLYMLCHGGLAGGERARELAVQTLQSGPVGGVVGSSTTAAPMGRGNIITTDMGGTTLDVSVIVGGRPLSRGNTVVEQHELFLNMVDVESIGAGGGSIGWIDEISGSLRVGPQSAGAEPGPACYGRGGTQPTITDADLILGVLNPGALIGGRLQLDRAAAEAAIRPLAERLEMSIEECAAGMVRVANANMSDLIRRMTLQRGLDPRDFTVYAFGGGGGAHASLYARPLGIREFVVPQSDAASVWSALGIGVADVADVLEQPILLTAPFDATVLQEAFTALEAQAEVAASEDRHVIAPSIRRFASCKYGMQVYEVDADVPDGPLDAAAADRIVESFEDAYAERFGAEAGYRDAGVQLTRIGLRIHGEVRKPRLEPAPDAGPEPDAAALKGERDVYWFELGDRVSTPIWRGAALRPGNGLPGPAIVEFDDTTVVVRPGDRMAVDLYGNAVVSIGSERDREPARAGTGATTEETA
jgi:N-methylhydantoinase A